MPGANCSIFDCSTSRTSRGISIFGLPRGNDEYNMVWREKLINVITKDRVIDKKLRVQTEKRTLHICEKHFSQSQLIQREYNYMPPFSQAFSLFLESTQQKTKGIYNTSYTWSGEIL